MALSSDFKQNGKINFSDINEIKSILDNKFNGIDVNNLILETAYLTTTYNYTATEDCFVTGRCYPKYNAENRLTIRIDSKYTFMEYSSSVGTSVLGIEPIPLKKNQKISFEMVNNGIEFKMIVFGVKK